MIGNGYWATGITVAWSYAGEGSCGWSGLLRYYDDGFVDDDADRRLVSTQGCLETRYAVRGEGAAGALGVVIDTLIEDAGRLGIRLGGPAGGRPALWFDGDGTSADCPPPDGWRAMLAEQALRINWETYKPQDAR